MPLNQSKPNTETNNEKTKDILTTPVKLEPSQ